jgi:hypothetical protein
VPASFHPWNSPANSCRDCSSSWGDHHHIHGDMARTAETANALLQALRGDADTLRRCSDGYANASAVLLKGLIRHLDDEEDLIVPLILDRGERRTRCGAPRIAPPEW